MHICQSSNGTYSPSAAARIDAITPVGRNREQSAPDAANPLIARAADSVDISSQARELSDRLPLTKVRTDLVDQIRAEIADGSYLTDDKLDVASDRLLQQLNTVG